MNDRVFLLKALGLAGGLLVLVALADAGLRAGRRAVELAGRQRRHPDAGDALRKLDCLRRFPGYKVALIGDSVVFGHSLAEHGDRLWRQHGLAPLLAERIRRERPQGGLMVMNLGLNGGCPPTWSAWASSWRPAGRILLVCDVGLRSFSSDFTPPEARYSRKWLAEMSYVPERPFVAPWPGHEVDVAAARLALRYSAPLQVPRLPAIPLPGRLAGPGRADLAAAAQCLPGHGRQESRRGRDGAHAARPAAISGGQFRRPEPPTPSLPAR